MGTPASTEVAGGFETSHYVMGGTRTVDPESVRYISQMLGIDEKTALDVVRNGPDSNTQRVNDIQAGIAERVARKFGRQEEDGIVRRWWNVTPDKILGENVSDSDIESMTYEEAIFYAKDARKAAENVGVERGHPYSQSEIDRCWEISLKCLIRAFSLKGSYYIFADIVEVMDKAGVLDKFPVLTVRLFETILVTSKRIEIFDGYYRFMKRIGKLEELFEFVKLNVPVFLEAKTGFSEALYDLMKTHPEGDEIRLKILSREYNAKKGGCDLFTYVFSYQVCYKGDYGRIPEVLWKVSKKHGGPQLFDPSRLLKSVTQKLIPDFRDFVAYTDATEESFIDYGRRFGMPENTSTREGAQAFVGRVSKDIDVKDRVGMLSERSEDIPVDESIQGLIDYYGAEGVDWTFYYDMVAIFMARFDDQPKDRCAFLEKLMEADANGKLRIPLEIKNVCVAKLTEDYFREGRHEDVVALCRKLCITPNVPMLRGAAYYYLKSCVEIVKKRGEEAGMEDLNLLGSGISEICKRMKDLSGEGYEADFETEIWREYLIPNYFKVSFSMTPHYGGSRALDICRDVVDEDPSNVHNQLVYASLSLNGAVERKNRIAATKSCFVEMNKCIGSSEIGGLFLRYLF